MLNGLRINSNNHRNVAPPQSFIKAGGVHLRVALVHLGDGFEAFAGVFEPVHRFSAWVETGSH